jgi:hypothetical protein
LTLKNLPAEAGTGGEASFFTGAIAPISLYRRRWFH